MPSIAAKPLGQVAITGKTQSATAMMPNAASIKPNKSDAKWRPFRSKVAKRSSPFYTQGY